jgi:CheY-like chemotaxis protein
MATILVVDDNPDACQPLAKLLSYMGYLGVCVTSGEAALEYVRNNPVQLMLLDVMMPGMDGLEVLRILRSEEQHQKLPVVMFSAVADPQFRDHAMSKGADDYWVKASFDFSKLKQQIERFVSAA